MRRVEENRGLPTPPSRVEQVYDAIVEDICTGRIPAGTPLRQEVLAKQYQVSRQPVQQALLLLKRQGLVRDYGRRGLEVSPLDVELVRDVYDMRALIDGYAARTAATKGLTEEALEHGHRLVRGGLQAFRDRAFADMIVADVEFHRFVVEQAGNPLLLESASVIWRNIQRVMSEVLLQGGCPAWVWDEHAAIFAAIEGGDAVRAERLARLHAEHGRHLIFAAGSATGSVAGVEAASSNGTAGSGTAGGDLAGGEPSGSSDAQGDGAEDDGTEEAKRAAGQAPG